MKVVDMTKGSPIKLIIGFAIPLFIGNIFQQFYNMVDTMVVGYFIGDSAIAAVGATSALVNLIINFAYGMNNGFALVVTRAFGAHDIARFKRSVAGTVILNAMVVTILTILSLTFIHPLMHFMNVSAEIYADTFIYISILFGGIITTSAYNMFAAILRSVGNSKTPLYFLILSSITNIAMDLLLVVLFGLGVKGAAIATVLAQGLSALLCGSYTVKHYKDLLPSKEDFKMSGTIHKDLMANGLAMAFMLTVVDIGSVIFQGANNALGNIFITAHTAARRILSMFMAPLTSITFACSTFVGQNYGAGENGRIKVGLRRSLVMEVTWGLIACGIIYLCAPALVKFVTASSSTEIINNAVMSLRIHLPFFPALGILVCMRSSMQAINIKWAPVVSSSIELMMKILSALIFIPTLGFLGTCITEPITWVLCMIFVVSVYFSYRKKILD